MTTDNFCFYLQSSLFQTSQQEVNSTVILPPLVFPASGYGVLISRFDDVLKYSYRSVEGPVVVEVAEVGELDGGTLL